MARKLKDDEAAASLVIRASRTHPADVEAQKAFIADACRSTRRSRRKLGLALLGNVKLIQGITKTANADHKKKGVKPIHAISMMSLVNRVFGGSR